MLVRGELNIKTTSKKINKMKIKTYATTLAALLLMCGCTIFGDSQPSNTASNHCMANAINRANAAIKWHTAPVSTQTKFQKCEQEAVNKVSIQKMIEQSDRWAEQSNRGLINNTIIIGNIPEKKIFNERQLIKEQTQQCMGDDYFKENTPPPAHFAISNALRELKSITMLSCPIEFQEGYRNFINVFTNYTEMSKKYQHLSINTFDSIETQSFPNNAMEKEIMDGNISQLEANKNLYRIFHKIKN